MSFTLEGKIGLKITTDLTADMITVNSEGRDYEVEQGDGFVIVYIAAKEMTNSFDITVVGDTKTLVPSDLLSNYEKPEYAQYAELANSLTDYCKAASVFFDGSTEVEDFSDVVVPEVLDEIGETDENAYKTSLVLESETALKVYVTSEKEINVDDVDADEGAVKVQVNANTVSVKYPNIAAHELGRKFRVNGNEFSALGYISKAVNQKTDKRIDNLSRALYKYYKDASAIKSTEETY